MRKRKTLETPPEAEPDAFGLLAEAEASTAEKRKRLAELRHRERDVTTELSALANAIREEHYDAGRAGRDPEEIAERRERMARLEQEMLDLVVLIDGATQGVKDAVHARSRILCERFPEFALRLEENEPSLIERRENLEGEVAKLEAAEQAHRAAWDEILRAVPVTPNGVSFLPREAIHVTYSNDRDRPKPLLHPAFRPDDPNDRLTDGLELNSGWPEWLQDTWKRTVHSAEEIRDQSEGIVRGTQTPARFLG
ncbi:MAG: hypothetical protein QOJ13_807 [Gaiellales bacterium]|nr:hypothetical protein [Gaiellales bacterium]